MRQTLVGFAGFAAAILAVAPADAQQTIRIGLILPYSGQFADPGAQADNGIKLYMQQHGDTVAGRKIEIIRKDTGGIAPDVAKRLAQELVVRDKVDLLAGFSLTPNALAAADVSAQAKKFMVVMNAAASIVTTKSPYMARVSFTLPQLNEPLGVWAYNNGVRKVYSIVADFAAGHDAEAAFHGAFKAAGGEIIGSVRYPVVNPDFSAFVQRAKDMNPEANLHFRSRRFAIAGDRQGTGRPWHRPAKDQDHGAGGADRRASLEEHGRHGPRHHHFRALRLQPRFEAEQGIRGRVQRRFQAQPGFLRRGRL